MSEKKFCPVCGKEFTRHHSNQVYCSEKCRFKKYGVYQPSTVKKCVECGKEFKTTRGKTAKYCSYGCQSEANIRSNLLRTKLVEHMKKFHPDEVEKLRVEVEAEYPKKIS